MAIDTASKRFSMLGFGNPTIKHLLPTGAIGAASRSTLLDLYGGIALGGIIDVPPLQKQWDYLTENITSLQVTTEITTLDVKAGC